MRPHHTDQVLISESDIQGRLAGLVHEIVADHDSKHYVLIGILRGSFMFLADLVRMLYEHDIHPQIDFMTLSSYESGVNTLGTVTIRKDVSIDIEGADVLIIDDILDTGRTLKFAQQHLRDKGAASIKSCMLLDKPSRRQVEVDAEYTGFTIEDIFVVGYGLDYDSYYRELPYIAAVNFTDGEEG